MSLLPKDLEVENVFLYVADAVRWDYTPDRLLNKGKAAKSVAASIHSPSSFASILSGLHLPQHQVGQFQDVLPEECFNLISSLDATTCFANTINHKIGVEEGGDDIISKTLDISLTHPTALNNVETPFVFVERGKGGHSPYGTFDGDSWEYYEDRGAMDENWYAQEYQEGIENDADWFQSRIEILEERGLLDDTLVIYTSDHGELLGERGMLAHSPPIHRRHVEIPTVFIHPKIEEGISRERVVRHVDLVPTILSMLDADIDFSQFPGRNLQERVPAEAGTSLFNQSETLYGELSVSLAYDSVWDSRGGYVFPRSPRAIRFGVGMKRMLNAPWRKFVRSNVLKNVPNLLEGTHTYGAPELSLDEATDRIQDVKNLEVGGRTGEIEVSKEQLKNLGYLE